MCLLDASHDKNFSKNENYRCIQKNSAATFKRQKPFFNLLNSYQWLEISVFRNICLFLANSYTFQIFIEQSIFNLQKRLLYEKASIFNGKYDAIKIKQFA